MITFLVGILILILGYIFYSKYTEKQFEPDSRQTPANKLNDGVDFTPFNVHKARLVQLLNIAGMGPILGAVQGILFGPVAFLIIPLGCVFMGGVHDYFSGMLSMRNDGFQITELVKKYLGKKEYYFMLAIVPVMLLLLATVFVFTSGDLIAERFFNQQDFSLTNPIILILYGLIILYFIIATLFPIDKIIGNIYPLFAITLLFATILLVIGFFVKGIHLEEINFTNLNLHPKHFAIIPLFFMTVSCGLLSGFHATQSTIISRTVNSEHDGRSVFFGMMILEGLIAMIWAAGAMHVYYNNLVPQNLIGTANVANTVATAFVPYIFTFLVTLTVVILPITSGDTALRGLRITIADMLKLNQKPIKNRLIIALPILAILILVLFIAKTSADGFSKIWRYFTFFNQLIAIPTFLYATIYLYEKKKNYFMTLIPGLFYVFITSVFMLNAKIGFNLPLTISKYIGGFLTVFVLIYIIQKAKKFAKQKPES